MRKVFLFLSLLIANYSDAQTSGTVADVDFPTPNNHGTKICEYILQLISTNNIKEFEKLIIPIQYWEEKYKMKMSLENKKKYQENTDILKMLFKDWVTLTKKYNLNYKAKQCIECSCFEGPLDPGIIGVGMEYKFKINESKFSMNIDLFNSSHGLYIDFLNAKSINIKGLSDENLIISSSPIYSTTKDKVSGKYNSGEKFIIFNSNGTYFHYWRKNSRPANYGMWQIVNGKFRTYSPKQILPEFTEEYNKAKKAENHEAFKNVIEKSLLKDKANILNASKFGDIQLFQNGFYINDDIYSRDTSYIESNVEVITITSIKEDIIVLKSGDEIIGDVTLVAEGIVKYKKTINGTLSEYSLSPSEIFMIKYSNGAKRVFNDNGKQSELVKANENSYKNISLSEEKTEKSKIDANIKNAPFPSNIYNGAIYSDKDTIIVSLKFNPNCELNKNQELRTFVIQKFSSIPLMKQIFDKGENYSSKIKRYILEVTINTNTFSERSNSGTIQYYGKFDISMLLQTDSNIYINNFSKIYDPNSGIVKVGYSDKNSVLRGYIYPKIESSLMQFIYNNFNCKGEIVEIIETNKSGDEAKIVKINLGSKNGVSKDIGFTIPDLGTKDKICLKVQEIYENYSICKVKEHESEIFNKFTNKEKLICVSIFKD